MYFSPLSGTWRGGDEITGPKFGPCDEITSPLTKLPDLK
jgi:hypothetical protein